MLYPERLPLSEAESQAVDDLIAANPDEQVSLTRSEPGDTGPLLVHVGDESYLVGEDGSTRSAD